MAAPAAAVYPPGLVDPAAAVRQLLARYWRALRTDRATRWRTAFLGLTALVIGMELRAATDGDPATDPWTDLTVRHVPWELALFVGGGGLIWLFGHFAIRYIRKHRAARKAGGG